MTVENDDGTRLRRARVERGTLMARRSYGTGSLYARKDAAGRESWYGRWYIGSERVKRCMGSKRQPGSREGLTRSQAEGELRRRMEATEAPTTPGGSQTVRDVGERLVSSLEARGRKASTLAPMNRR